MKSLVLALSIAVTTCAPVPAASQTEPGKEKETNFLALDMNQGARCMDAEGCIIITKAALRALLAEVEANAPKVCGKSI